MKPFRPEHYYEAALERMAQARLLYQQKDCHALAMYVAGVAVECMLRAFKGKRTKTLDERHDLEKLFKTSGLVHSDRGPLPKDLLAAIAATCHLWSNDYRYASEERLRSFLKKDAAWRSRIKGDILKASALRLMQSAQTVVNRGKVLWDSSRKPGTS
jgi:HEPN domain-containing protein